MTKPDPRGERARPRAAVLLGLVGPEDFYLVHAGAAHLPDDVRARSGPDGWFIYAWVDRTLPPAGGGALSIKPTSNKTWGQIKALYR